MLHSASVVCPYFLGARLFDIMVVQNIKARFHELTFSLGAIRHPTITGGPLLCCLRRRLNRWWPDVWETLNGTRNAVLARNPSHRIQPLQQISRAEYDLKKTRSKTLLAGRLTQHRNAPRGSTDRGNRLPAAPSRVACPPRKPALADRHPNCPSRP